MIEDLSVPQLPTAKERKEMNRQRYKSSEQCLIFLPRCTPPLLLWIGREGNSQKRQELKMRGRGRAIPRCTSVTQPKEIRNGINIFFVSPPSLLSCSQPPPSLFSFLAYPD